MNPEVTLVPDPSAQSGEQRVVVQVSGVLCRGLCLTRVQRALDDCPGVVAVTPLSPGGHFLVRYIGEMPLEALRRAALGKVVFPRLRALLGRLALWSRVRG